MTNAKNEDERTRQAERKLDKVSTGGQLGGTHFGQAGGDGATKNARSGKGRRS